ncbi:hypothetical protein DXA34_04185 [[Clostridium] symbiosum]|nr:hypothetical protein DXA34_04185 [[Clostridium] symbiosum]
MRSPPERPADGVVGVYESFVPGENVVVWGCGRRFSPGRKTQGQGYRPSTGLRPLIVLRIKCGGRTLSRQLSASICI